MKLLHSADWHLGAPLQSHSPHLRKALASLPDIIVDLALAEGCDLMLLAGDLFDGAPTAEALTAMRQALARARMPVFIAPGNHDPASLWPREGWSENVHIFRSTAIDSVALPGLNVRVFGAAFTQSHSPALLDQFRAECTEQYALGVFHGDPMLPDSPYNPISGRQVMESGLDYLALGHIHKGDSLQAGDTICAWPGCPMGRGFDETGEKGVLIAELDGVCRTRFVPLPLPRFYSLTTSVDGDAFAALSQALPAVGSEDHFRVTLTGESEALDVSALTARFPQFPNLQLRDQTYVPTPLWDTNSPDSLEGIYFSLLRNADAPEAIRQLSAKLSRQILLGQEVVL